MVEYKPNSGLSWRKINPRLILFILLFVSFIYFVYEIRNFLEGQRGYIRGSLTLFLSTIFAISLTCQKKKIILIIMVSIVLILSIGAIDLLFHNPGVSIIDLTPRFLNDFNIYYFGSMELYEYNDSPYGIEQKYHVNISAGFPFPIYAIYWGCSGFGLLDKAQTGLIITILNIVLALLIIWLSLKLTGLNTIFRHRSDNIWWSLVILFFVFTSPIWGIIMNGLSTIIAGFFLISGLWISRTYLILYEVLSGLLLSIGIMIKPNYVPFLFYFLTNGVNQSAINLSTRNQKLHNVRIFLFSILFFLFFVLLTIVIPDGVNLNTYLQFLNQVLPLWEIKIADWSISLIGLIKTLFPCALSSMIIFFILLTLLLIWGILKKWSWHIWLVIPLLISPITWPTYTVILLPLYFLIAKQAVEKTDKSFELALLIIGTGTLYLRYNLVSAVGLILIFYLALKQHPPEESGRLLFD